MFNRSLQLVPQASTQLVAIPRDQYEDLGRIYDGQYFLNIKKKTYELLI